MSQFLGVDVGTTRTKVACYDATSQRLVAVRSARTPVVDDAWGGRRDADSVVALVLVLLAELLGDPAVDASDLAGVAVGSVGEEVVLTDNDGRPVAPVLAWHAGHGADALRTLDSADDWTHFDNTFSVFKLAWMWREMPDALARARTFTGLADHVAVQLSGLGGEAILNTSHASRTGLLDVRTGHLRGDILAALDIDLELPRLLPSATQIGVTSPGSPLPAGVPVVTGGHDHWCGAFGSGVRAAGEVHVSAGTSEAQFVLVESVPDTVPRGVDVGMFVVGGLRYLHRATPAGQYYQTWHDLLYADTGDDLLWREVAHVIDRVEPAAINADRRTLRFPDFRTDVSRAEVMASLQAGLAIEADRTTTRLADLAGIAVQQVTVAGVAAASEAWRDLRRRVAHHPLRFVAETESTVLGVALLAQLGTTGAADDPHDPSLRTHPPGDLT